MPERDEKPNPCEVIPTCPVCLKGPLELAMTTSEIDVCVCLNCGVSMTVPVEAWKKRNTLPSS
jgi:hypothetical protein